MADRRNERYGRERRERRDFDQEYNPQTNYGAREENYARQGGGQEHGRFNRDQRWTGSDEMDEGQDPNRRYEPYRRDDGGRETGPGASGYSSVGPYSSAGFGGSYSGMGSYGAGYSGGMGYHGRRGQYAGRGPKGYRRSDERIREDINERLTDHPEIDATEIEVAVTNGEVTLTGTVDHRHAKRLAEDIAEGVSGVHDVHNQIRVNRNAGGEERRDQGSITTLGIGSMVPGEPKNRS